MAPPNDSKFYLDVDELVALSGLSESTVWRLKRAGKIPFYQPGGKGTRVKFPVDAIEVAAQQARPEPPPAANGADSPQRLPGPIPDWMTSRPKKQESKNNNENK